MLSYIIIIAWSLYSVLKFTAHRLASQCSRRVYSARSIERWAGSARAPTAYRGVRAMPPSWCWKLHVHVTEQCLHPEVGSHSRTQSKPLAHVANHVSAL